MAERWSDSRRPLEIDIVIFCVVKVFLRRRLVHQKVFWLYMENNSLVFLLLNHILVKDLHELLSFPVLKQLFISRFNLRTGIGLYLGVGALHVLQLFMNLLVDLIIVDSAHAPHVLHRLGELGRRLSLVLWPLLAIWILLRAHLIL